MATFETTGFLVISGEKIETNIRVHYTWHPRFAGTRETPEEPAGPEIHGVEIENGQTSRKVPLYTELYNLPIDMLEAIEREIKDNH